VEQPWVRKVVKQWEQRWGQRQEPHWMKHKEQHWWVQNRVIHWGKHWGAEDGDILEAAPEAKLDAAGTW